MSDGIAPADVIQAVRDRQAIGVDLHKVGIRGEWREGVRGSVDVLEPLSFANLRNLTIRIGQSALHVDQIGMTGSRFAGGGSEFTGSRRFGSIFVKEAGIDEYLPVVHARAGLDHATVRVPSRLQKARIFQGIGLVQRAVVDFRNGLGDLGGRRPGV